MHASSVINGYAARFSHLYQKRRYTVVVVFFLKTFPEIYVPFDIYYYSEKKRIKRLVINADDEILYSR